MLNLRNISTRVTGAVAVSVLAAGLAMAQDSAQKGLDIAVKSDLSDQGFGDSQATLKMILRNAAGQETSREMRVMTMERPGQKTGDMSVSVFMTPADIKGTALLSHANIKANDDQWLFLPATGRVKRISSGNKSGPFVGSEFSYEDITAQEVGKYTYNWLRTDKCGSATCDVIERIPAYKNSGYSRQEVWIDQKTSQFQQIEFYDRAGAKVKRMAFSGYRKVGGVLRAHKLTMVNLRNGKSTDLIFSGYKFRSGLTSADFQPAAIERLR